MTVLTVARQFAFFACMCVCECVCVHEYMLYVFCMYICMCVCVCVCVEMNHSTACNRVAHSLNKVERREFFYVYFCCDDH